MIEPLKLTDHVVLTAAREQVSCELMNEAVILNLRNGIYYGLNPVGARIWALLQEPRTVGEIRCSLQEEFDVETIRCAQDLKKLFEELLRHGLIEIQDDAAAQNVWPPTD